MRFSGKLALKVGAVGVAAGAILAPVTAATRPHRLLAATPNTGLTNGDIVTVRRHRVYATGATIAVNMVQCSAPAVRPHCDLTDIVPGTTDGSAQRHLHQDVHRPHRRRSAMAPAPPARAPAHHCRLRRPIGRRHASAGYSPSPHGTPTVHRHGHPEHRRARAATPSRSAAPLPGVNRRQPRRVRLLPGHRRLRHRQRHRRHDRRDGSLHPRHGHGSHGAVGDKTCAERFGVRHRRSTAATPADQTTHRTPGARSIRLRLRTPAGPTVTVKPATDVSSGDRRSRLSGTGFPANQPTCTRSSAADTDGQADCDTGTLGTGTTGADGSFSAVKVTVHTGAVGNEDV